jgi:hypothetical protein
MRMLSRFDRMPEGPHCARSDSRIGPEEYAIHLAVTVLIEIPSEGEERTILRKLIVCFLLLVPSAGIAGFFGDDFYERLYERGMNHFRAADYQAAFFELRIAAFGLPEQLEKFEMAEIYAAAAASRIGNEAWTRDAMLCIVSAEKLQPRLRSMTIPAPMREEIRRSAAILLTNEERATLSIP